MLVTANGIFVNKITVQFIFINKQKCAGAQTLELILHFLYEKLSFFLKKSLKIKFYWFKGDKISAIKVIAYYIPFVVVAKNA